MIYGDAGEINVLENVGLDARQLRGHHLRRLRKSPCGFCARCARLRADVPILVRTQDDAKLEELQAAGATEVVPETFEASLMLLSHLLLLLKLPVTRVIRTVNDIRSHRYGMLRQYFRDSGAEYLDDRTHFARSFTASCCRRMPGRWAAASPSSSGGAPRPP